ncbi:hypothetical protein BD779DRAFT_1672922 [Infundibulicybe gibba]|nr:hypothetical protein BD779DRAFT_1672922 [Infundibulicybe gibba]
MLPDYFNDYLGTPCQSEAESHYDAWIARIAAEEFPLNDNKPTSGRRSSSDFIPTPTNSTSGSATSGSPPSLYHEDDFDVGSEPDSDIQEIIPRIQEAPTSCPESYMGTKQVRKLPIRRSSYAPQATAQLGARQFSRTYALLDGEGEDSSDGAPQTRSISPCQQ